MPSFSKYAPEQFPIGFEFAGTLPAGASLSAVTLQARDITDESDQTAVVLQSATGAISGTQALVRVREGTPGHLYMIDFTVVLTTGDILLRRVIMLIRA